jgi:ATP-dependent DNA ligase
MMAERLFSPMEILEKLGGKCIAEYKYDGERLQAHKRGDDLTHYPRRLESISNQYPERARRIRTARSQSDSKKTAKKFPKYYLQPTLESAFQHSGIEELVE